MSHESGLPFPIPSIPTSDPSSARYQGDWCAVGKQGYLAGNTHTVNKIPHNNTPHKDIYRISTQSIRFPTYHIPHSLTLLETKVDFCVHSELLLAYNWKQVSGHTSFNLQRSSRLEYSHWQTLLC
mgnify:CR=1 FL=1